MAKTIFLKEEQLEYIKRQTNDVKLFDKDCYYPLNDVSLSERLSRKAYDSAIKSFGDDICDKPLSVVKEKFNKYLTICQKKEHNIKQQLEKLCYNTIVELFNIPEDKISFNCELVEFIDNGSDFHVTANTDEDYEYQNLDAIDNETSEVEKRKLVNMIVMGIALDLFDRARSVYNKELFEIDEELPHLYSKLVKLNQFLLFKDNFKVTDKNSHQGGFVKVVLGDEERVSKIIVKALTFPTLLIETIRGVMELISSNGLPDDFNSAKHIMSQADVLCDEPNQMVFGRELWQMVTNGEELDSHVIPSFFSNLITLEPNDFILLLKELSHNTKDGKATISQLMDDCKYEFEYGNFKNDILQKQNDKSLLSDEYFSSDELYDM